MISRDFRLLSVTMYVFHAVQVGFVPCMRWGSCRSGARYSVQSAKPHRAWSSNAQILGQIQGKAGHITRKEMEDIRNAQQEALVTENPLCFAAEALASKG